MEKVGRLTIEVDRLKNFGTGDKSRRAELLRGETMERELSFRRKCELLGVSPSTAYAQRKPSANRRNEEDMKLAGKIEEIYLKYPFYGNRRIARELSGDGSPVNRKRVKRLMRLMDLVGQAPGPATSKPHPQHKTYPYLLKNVSIVRPN